MSALDCKANILPFYAACSLILPTSLGSNTMEQKILKKRKTNKGKVLNNHSSKKIYSLLNHNAQIKTKERNSEDFKHFSKHNFTTEEFLNNVTNVDEQRIRSYADVLSKTENIWSQNNHALDKKPFNFSMEDTDVKSNELEKETDQKQEDLETDSAQKKTDIEGNSALWEAAVWKDLNPLPKCDDRYSADNLLAEIKSLVPEGQSKHDKSSTNLNGVSSPKEKDSKFLEELDSLGNFDYLEKLLDEDSAYGSDESLPRSSPEPTDIETGFNTSGNGEMFENRAQLTKSDYETNLNSNTFESIIPDDVYSKVCLEQDSDSISIGSDCDMYETSEFREFMKGLSSAKPRLVVHEDATCAICNDKIVDELSLLNRFGLLLNCEHPFCYRCISSATYRTKDTDSAFKVACPICKAFSPGIVSSPRWIKSKIKKIKLFNEQKSAFNEELILKLYFNGVFFKVMCMRDIKASSNVTSKSHRSKTRKHVNFNL